jgi:hypothetical protein
MEAIKELLSLDFTAVILTVFIIMSSIIAMYSIIGKFSEIIGKPVKWVKQRQLDHDLLEKNKNDIKELSDKHEADTKKYETSHQKLIDDIEILKDLLLDKQISDYRWEIINTADKISNGRIVSKECLKHAIATYDKYEKIIEKYNIKNGEVSISIKVIRGEYAKILADEKQVN